jgi:hypothetical protein
MKLGAIHWLHRSAFADARNESFTLSDYVSEFILALCVAGLRVKINPTAIPGKKIIYQFHILAI